MMGHIAIILGMGRFSAASSQFRRRSGAGPGIGGKLRPERHALGAARARHSGGIPVFFEVGLVLLMPIVVDAARRSGRPPMLVGLPVLAGLSAMHCLLPPIPEPCWRREYHAALAPVMLWGLV